MTTFEPIVGLFCIAAIAVLIYGPWQETCTDYARQVIFEERDRLFDLAIKRDLDFNSPEYRTIRSSLEIMIRFAHDLTITKLIWIYLYSALLDKENKKEKSGLLSSVELIANQAVRENVLASINRANLAIIFMMIAKSPVMWIVFLVSIPLLIMAKANVTIKKCLALLVNKIGDRAQQEAEIVGPSNHQIAA